MQKLPNSKPVFSFPYLHSKAQIKMFETVAILIVFFFLLGIGATFYFGAQEHVLNKETLTANEQQAFHITLLTLYLPELDCTFLTTSRDNCIDIIKLHAFTQLLTNETISGNYFTDFGFSTITISQIYPQKEHILLYNNTPQTYQSITTSQNPILLYNALTDSYAFGVMEVNVYA